MSLGRVAPNQERQGGHDDRHGEHVRQHIADQGANATGGTPAEFGERISREIVLWHKIVRQSGMAVD